MIDLYGCATMPLLYDEAGAPLAPHNTGFLHAPAAQGPRPMRWSDGRLLEAQ